MNDNGKKIMVTSDWHLYCSQYNNTKRKSAFFKAAYDVIDLAVKEGINVVLNAGDILDNIYPKQDDMQEVKNLNNYLIEKGITMYTISGNHDYTPSHWVEIIKDERSPYGIRIIDDTTVDIFGLKVRGIKGFNKQMILDKIYDDTNVDIILLHTFCKQFVQFYTKKETFDVNDIDFNKFPSLQTIIVGDIHVHDIVINESNNQCMVLSPGSIEMVSASENIEKFVYILEVEGKHVAAENVIGRDGTSYVVENGIRPAFVSSIKTVALPCDYKRIKSPYISSIEVLDEFIDYLIKEDVGTTEDDVIIYYTYKPDVVGVLDRIKELINGRPNIILVRNAKNKKAKSKDGKKDIMSSDNVNTSEDDYVSFVSLHDFVTTELSRTDKTYKLSDKGKALLLASVNKQVNISDAIKEYLS